MVNFRAKVTGKIFFLGFVLSEYDGKYLWPKMF